MLIMGVCMQSVIVGVLQRFQARFRMAHVIRKRAHAEDESGYAPRTKTIITRTTASRAERRSTLEKT